MRIVFMGTPEFAVPSLQALAESQYKISAVVTQPDRESGRGRKVTEPAVKVAALEYGIKVIQPVRMKDPVFLEQLKSLKPDLLVVVAFRVLPKEVLAIPSWGAINLHGSLLPKYRGAAPIQWAVANGEKETGVTVFKLDEDIDTGPILARKETPIDSVETAGDVYNRLMHVGADLLMETVTAIGTDSIQPFPQDSALSSPAPKLKKEDGRINWKLPAEHICNRIRGFNPFPGSFTRLPDGKNLCVTHAEPLESSGTHHPGTVLESERKIVISAGTGAVNILRVKPECRKEMDAHDFLRGCTVFRAGDTLG